MKYRSLLLASGILLSAVFKYIQWTESSLIGDLLILPAGTCFVLAILFFIPQFQKAFQSPKTKNKAILLAVLASLTVFSFQLFTMLLFGYRQSIGYVFIPIVLIFAGWSLLVIDNIKKEENN